MMFSSCMLAGSPDHLIGLEAEEWGNGDPERLCGLKVDDELVLHRLLHRKISRWVAFQDLIHQGGNASPEVRHLRPIAHQSPHLHKGPWPIERWQPTLGRERYEAFLMRGEEESRQDQQCASAMPADRIEGALEPSGLPHLYHVQLHA